MGCKRVTNHNVVIDIAISDGGSDGLDEGRPVGDIPKTLPWTVCFAFDEGTRKGADVLGCAG